MPKMDKELLATIIEKGMQNMIEQEFTAALKQAVENVERRKGEVVAGILVDIMKITDFQVMEDRLVFTIKTK